MKANMWALEVRHRDAVPQSMGETHSSSHVRIKMRGTRGTWPPGDDRLISPLTVDSQVLGIRKQEYNRLLSPCPDIPRPPLTGHLASALRSCEVTLLEVRSPWHDQPGTSQDALPSMVSSLSIVSTNNRMRGLCYGLRQHSWVLLKELN